MFLVIHHLLLCDLGPFLEMDSLSQVREFKEKTDIQLQILIGCNQPKQRHSSFVSAGDKVHRNRNDCDSSELELAAKVGHTD